MLSKPVIFAAGLALVQGDDKLTNADGAVTWDSATHKAWGCARCIRHGFNWVSTDYASNALTGTDPTGFCCAATITDSACDAAVESGGAVNSGAGYKQSSDMGVDIALSACPSRSDICGTSLAQFSEPADDDIPLTIDTATNNLDEDDQCVYTIEATCGAPGFTIDSTSTLGDTSFAIFYMDFLNSGDAGATTDSAGNAYTVTATAVADMTPVSDDGDQTDHLPNDPHRFMHTPTNGVQGTNDFVVPGRFAGKWFKSYNDEVAAYDAEVLAYDAHKGEWETYNSWVTTWASADPWTKTWGYLTGQGVLTDPGIPAWPPNPPAYGGPAVGLGTNDLLYTSGFGKPTSGMMSVEGIEGQTGNGRSFGVKGEGYNSDDFTGSHASDTMKPARYGLKIPAEDPDACTKSYSKYVVIPKQALTTGNLVMTLGALPWSDQYAFTAAATPIPTTPLTQEEMGLA